MDCIGAGKSLCDEVGVRGFPTLKFGDPTSLSDYKGGRTYDELAQFAAGLGPICSPANLDICSAEKKAMIQTFRAMGAKEREEKLRAQEGEVKKIEAEFSTAVEGIRARHQAATDKKNEAVKAIRASGLDLLKAVKAHAASSA